MVIYRSSEQTSFFNEKDLNNSSEAFSFSHKEVTGKEIVIELFTDKIFLTS